MKVFLYASPRAVKFDKYVGSIYEAIEKLGYQHISDEVKTHAIRGVLTNKTFADKEYLHHVGGLLLSMSKADICIFEVSHQSLGAGYLIDKSLEEAKPTIVLYYESNIPHILSVIDNDKLIVKSYNEKNLKKVVQNTLTYAREKRDKRFNFFLSPKLLSYLEDVSNEQGVTKSKILRDLIVEHMRKRANKPEE